MNFADCLFCIKVVDDALLADLLVVNQCVVIRLVASVVGGHKRVEGRHTEGFVELGDYLPRKY